MLVKTRKDTDYTETVVYIYNILANKYKYTARISRFWELLKDACLIFDDFEILDRRVIQNGSFDSYLVDSFIDWKNNKPVDFEEIYKSFLTAGDFTMREKLIFSNGNIEERLWAIYLAIDNPNLTLNIINKND